MTKDDLKKVLIGRLKEEVSITEEMITAVVESMAGDIETIMANKKAEYTISIWDKVSPINSAPASYVLGQVPYTLPDWNGITYLIAKDGKVMYMQHDDFREQGWQPITSEAMAFELADLQLRPSLEEAVVAVAISKLRGE